MAQIAVLGYGVVGSGVVEVCRNNRVLIGHRAGEPVEVRYVLDLRDFPGDPVGDRLIRDPRVIFDDPEVSVVVETIGGTGAALTFTRQAMIAGKHVVTSNKELVAKHGPELLELAREHGVRYLFEASVGGGIPLILPLLRGLTANQVTAITGILNGTTNYILTRMQQARIDFAAALEEARRQGYAEQNPIADVGGFDAARKIAILASIAQARFLDSEQIHTEGIDQLTPADQIYAASLGCKLKLIGSFRRLPDGRAELLVAPMLVPLTHPLCVADDVFNAVLIEGNAVGEVLFYGRGAGKQPTASAVIADIIECVRQNGQPPYPMVWRTDKSDIIAPHESCRVRALLRLNRQVDEADVRARLGECQQVEAAEPDEQVYLAGLDDTLDEGTLAEAIRVWGEQVVSRIRLLPV